MDAIIGPGMPSYHSRITDYTEPDFNPAAAIGPRLVCTIDEFTPTASIRRWRSLGVPDPAAVTGFGRRQVSASGTVEWTLAGGGDGSDVARAVA
eukprot:7078858-Pyramimonas_sp.AAC.1